MDKPRKCRWRKQEAERVRRNRVTQGYIEKKYPEIYQESLEFYEFLNKKYPDKKDLRRTNEYEWIKTGISGETSKKFYSRRKTMTTTTTTTTTLEDRMELVIPLMRKDSAGSSQPPADDQPPADEQPRTEQPTIDATDIEIPGIMSTLNQEIPDHIIEDIMTELRGDPDIDTFFSTLSDGFDQEELICS